MEFKSTMKTKTPIRILTICLFISLILGLVLYKGGYLFSEQKIRINDEQIRSDMPATSEEDYDVDPFKNLKSDGGFVPKNFGKLYVPPPPEFNYSPGLASSKSLVITELHYKKYIFLSTDYESTLIRDQFSSEKAIKEK